MKRISLETADAKLLPPQLGASVGPTWRVDCPCWQFGGTLRLGGSDVGEGAGGKRK